MLIVFGMLLSGVLVGYIMRRIERITFIGKIILLFIFLLLFSLGISVGKNEMILNNLSSIGLQALIITIGAVAGSIVMTTIIYNKFFRKEQKR